MRQESERLANSLENNIYRSIKQTIGEKANGARPNNGKAGLKYE